MDFDLIRREFVRGDDAAGFDNKDTVAIDARRLPDGRIAVALPSGEVVVRASRTDDGAVLLTWESAPGVARTVKIPVVREKDGAISLHFDGRSFRFSHARGARSRAPDVQSPERSGALLAPMAGIVTRLNVAVGDLVARYQPIAGVEAMKVLATIDAPFDGAVTEISAAIGDRVEAGARLVTIARTLESL